MICFTRFINDTDSPVITVSVDDSRVFSDVIKGSATPCTALETGTREITVLQNNNKLLIDKIISLPPFEYATVIITQKEIFVVV